MIAIGSLPTYCTWIDRRSPIGTRAATIAESTGTSPFGTFVGNLAATFSSFWNGALMYDANCTTLPFWATDRGIILRLLDVAGDFVIGADADLVQGGASNPKLFAVNSAGQLQWRNDDIDPVIDFGTGLQVATEEFLYVVGRDLTNNLAITLFQVATETGRIVRRLPVDDYPRIAVAADGATYISSGSTVMVVK